MLSCRQHWSPYSALQALSCRPTSLSVSCVLVCFRVGAPLVLRELIIWFTGWESTDGDKQVRHWLFGWGGGELKRNTAATPSCTASGVPEPGLAARAPTCCFLNFTVAAVAACPGACIGLVLAPNPASSLCLHPFACPLLAAVPSVAGLDVGCRAGGLWLLLLPHTPPAILVRHAHGLRHAPAGDSRRAGQGAAPQLGGSGRPDGWQGGWCWWSATHIFLSFCQPLRSRHVPHASCCCCCTCATSIFELHFC